MRKSTTNGGRGSSRLPTSAASATTVSRGGPVFCLRRVPLARRTVTTSGRVLSSNLFGVKVVFGSEVRGFPHTRRSLKQLIRGFPSFNRLSITCCGLCLVLKHVSHVTSTGVCGRRLVSHFPSDGCTGVLTSPSFTCVTMRNGRLRSSLCTGACGRCVTNGCGRMITGTRCSFGGCPVKRRHPGFVFLRTMDTLRMKSRGRFLTRLGRLIRRCPRGRVASLTTRVLGKMRRKHLLTRNDVSFNDV